MSLDLFSKNAKFLLAKKGLQGKQVAAALRVSQGKISTWINGKFEPPYSYLIEFCDFLGVSIDDILRKDLEELHLIGDDESSGKSNFDTPNVTPFITPKAPFSVKGGPSFPNNLLEKGVELLRAKEETIAAQQVTIHAQERAIAALENTNAVVNQQLMEIRDENTNLKRALPVIPADVAGHSGGGKREKTA